MQRVKKREFSRQEESKVQSNVGASMANRQHKHDLSSSGHQKQNTNSRLNYKNSVTVELSVRREIHKVVAFIT